MLRLTIYKPQSLTIPIKIDRKGEIILGAKLVGEPYFNLLYDLCRFDVAINNSKKQDDTALYLIPSEDNNSFVVDRRGNFIRLQLETHLHRFNLCYPATVQAEVIYYQNLPVLKLYTSKINTEKVINQIDIDPELEDNLTDAGVPRTLAKDILKNKKAKEVPKKVSPSKRNPQAAKNDALTNRGSKIGRPSKKGIKNKVGKN